MYDVIHISGNIVPSKDEQKNGDIYIHPVSDKEGQAAIKGRHSNYGYSGNYWAEIFDGEKWRHLKLHTLVSNTHYDSQQEKKDVEEQIKYEVSKLKFRQVTKPKDSRQYFELL